MSLDQEEPAHCRGEVAEAADHDDERIGFEGAVKARQARDDEGELCWRVAGSGRIS